VIGRAAVTAIIAAVRFVIYTGILIEPYPSRIVSCVGMKILGSLVHKEYKVVYYQNALCLVVLK
jgi:hypothetical protein